MNSIRPITFVEAPLAATATFAVAALAIVLLGVTQTMAAAAGVKSAAVLRDAELLPRGPERDQALSRALEAAVDAIGLAPENGELKSRSARALYLQATTATVPDISIPLLTAAETAAQDASKTSPSDAGAPATLAMIAYARAGGPNAAMAALVAKSYAGRARDLETALWRAQAASVAWPALDAGTKLAASDETCALMKAPQTRPRAMVVAKRVDVDCTLARR